VVREDINSFETSSVLKTQGGAGFRNYLANAYKTDKIHDLVELYPFEGAVNRTALVIISKGQTEFSIPCVMWSNPKSRGIDIEAELEDVKKTTKQLDMILAPVKIGRPETSWMGLFLIDPMRRYKML